MPKWHPPAPASVEYDVGLRVMNSLTRNKDKFIAMDGGRTVRWYMCGPTVYAPSHMGHARTYLGFDIIRRILENYFGFEVDLIMNITDIDDKIIARATELGIPHKELSSKYEQEFHEDMQALGVAPPSVLTRVTDYIPEIVTFIETLIEKGLAYVSLNEEASNKSVYFHVEEFEKVGTYCKLEPEAIQNAAKLLEGEGILTQTHTSDKRSPRDFALWKGSDDAPNAWSSPWGNGRPGWHIECSVMASEILNRMGVEGNKMDVHSGGIDLKFPHHDNELAQSEAHNGCCQWVNYFIHTGHLHIQGFKMSKSLKNFITIRQALEQNSPRQVRFCFLLHQYNTPMDYGDATMSHALVCDKTFGEFFLNVKGKLREIEASSNLASSHQKWGPHEVELQTVLDATKKNVDAALKDDFDTPRVLKTLLDLVKAVNLYMERDNDQIVSLLLKTCALYVTKIFNVFGLSNTPPPNIGYTIGMSSASDGGANSEEQLVPILNALMNFRSDVRNAGRANPDDMNAILKYCDTFRDDTLVELGIRLEDKASGGSVWKLCDPAELKRERDLKEQETQRKLEEKRALQEQAAQKEAMAKLTPEDFMKALTLEDGKTLKYDPASFDAETGLPTKLSSGEDLNKNQAKKANKEFTAQKKKYEKYLKSTQ